MTNGQEREARQLLAEGVPIWRIAEQLGTGVGSKSLRTLRKKMAICSRCAEPLRELDPESLCGWCKAELQVEVEA